MISVSIWAWRLSFKSKMVPCFIIYHKCTNKLGWGHLTCLLSTWAAQREVNTLLSWDACSDTDNPLIRWYIVPVNIIELTSSEFALKIWLEQKLFKITEERYRNDEAGNNLIKTAREIYLAESVIGTLSIIMVPVASSYLRKMLAKRTINALIGIKFVFFLFFSLKKKKNW